MTRNLKAESSMMTILVAFLLVAVILSAAFVLSNRSTSSSTTTMQTTTISGQSTTTINGQPTIGSLVLNGQACQSCSSPSYVVTASLSYLSPTSASGAQVSQVAYDWGDCSNAGYGNLNQLGYPATHNYNTRYGQTGQIEQSYNVWYGTSCTTATVYAEKVCAAVSYSDGTHLYQCGTVQLG
jgi:hypothetical protein